jgi:hypothetical protein
VWRGSENEDEAAAIAIKSAEWASVSIPAPTIADGDIGDHPAMVGAESQP